MTQEDKKLLLQDLSARLPYGVKCNVKYIINNETTYGEDVESECIDIIKRISFDTYSVYTEWLGHESVIEDIKPYLRPMSSMTDEEKETLQSFHDIISDENYSDGYSPSAWDAITAWEDYCNSKHLDYRGLIKKELAIAVTEENNPYKE